MSNNSSRVQSAQGERAAGTCQSALYLYRWLKDGQRPHGTCILARLYQRYSEKASRLPNFGGGASTPPMLFQVFEGNTEKKVIDEFHWSFSEARPTRHHSVLVMFPKTLQLCWCKKGRLNVWSTVRFLATWRSRSDPSFTGSGGFLPLQSTGTEHKLEHRFRLTIRE